MACWVRQVPVMGKEDKRGIPAMTSCTAAGNMLPLQVIHSGKPALSLASAVLSDL